MPHRLILTEKARHAWSQQTELLYVLFAVFPPELAEIQSCLGALSLGSWLLLPFDTFHTGRGFSPFLALGIPESDVGIFFCFYGCAGLLALLFDLRGHRSKLALFGMFFWLTLALVFQFGNPAGPAFIFLAPLYLLNLLAYIKARPRNRV